jgi:predicted Rossmann-fold nucleotide-binding protein
MPKPCGLLNVRQYNDRLMDFLDHMVEEKFVEFTHHIKSQQERTLPSNHCTLNHSQKGLRYDAV